MGGCGPSELVASGPVVSQPSVGAEADREVRRSQSRARQPRWTRGPRGVSRARWVASSRIVRVSNIVSGDVERGSRLPRNPVVSALSDSSRGGPELRPCGAHGAGRRKKRRDRPRVPREEALPKRVEVGHGCLYVPRQMALVQLALVSSAEHDAAGPGGPTGSFGDLFPCDRGFPRVQRIR